MQAPGHAGGVVSHLPGPGWTGKRLGRTSAAGGLQLPHGYTNATTLRAGVVGKSYLGPGARRRLRVERAALSGLAGRFPVPAILPGGDGELDVQAVASWHGQEVLDDGRHASAVLRLCGQIRRRLSGIDPATVPGLPGSGEVIVHGDFGPQNLLLSSDAQDVLAVVDWEWCHRGSAVEDLAWAEWIVRMHHRAALPHLRELFGGYGIRPAWPERKAAMLRICRRYREFSRQWPNPDAARTWKERTAITQAFQP